MLLEKLRVDYVCHLCTYTCIILLLEKFHVNYVCHLRTYVLLLPWNLILNDLVLHLVATRLLEGQMCFGHCML